MGRNVQMTIHLIKLGVNLWFSANRVNQSAAATIVNGKYIIEHKSTNTSTNHEVFLNTDLTHNH